MNDDSQRNLIVNYLPNSLTPAAFKNMFSPFGEIDNCRIIFDKLTGVSQGYGFVKYKSTEAAAKAIEIMNGQSVENKTIKVSLAHPIPGVTGTEQANLYVANLPKHLTKIDLEQMFIPYGTLIETKILLDPATGMSRGVGFVRFAVKEQAQVAIDSLHNQIPIGSETPIVVRFSDTKDDKVRKGKSPGPALGGYGGGVAAGRQLRYNPMAAAPQVQVPQYANQGPSAFAYQTPGGVTQDQLAAATAAAAAVAGNGYGMFPTAVQNTVTPGLAYCLFVYNLPPDADEALLCRLFGPFGAISDVKIIRDTDQRCKGFGFVHYLKLEDAQQAIISMNGYQLGHKYLQVSFKKQTNKQK